LFYMYKFHILSLYILRSASTCCRTFTWFYEISKLEHLWDQVNEKNLLTSLPKEHLGHFTFALFCFSPELVYV
jgi:hypothetical protein